MTTQDTLFIAFCEKAMLQRGAMRIIAESGATFTVREVIGGYTKPPVCPYACHWQSNLLDVHPSITLHNRWGKQLARYQFLFE